MTGKQLKNSILQWAIQGKLVPQDPNDEPASVLLEKIRAEKARLVKEGKLKKKDLEVKPIAEDEIPFEIPKGWEWCRIGDLFNHSSGKQQSSSNNGKGTPQKFITTSNLYWGRFVLDNVKVMNFTDEEIITCSATKGDLLVCEGGAGYGRSAIWDKDYDICLQNHVHRLRPCIPGVCEYVYHFIYLLKESNQLAPVGTAMPGLSANRLKDLIIPLPPLAEQHRIVAKIEELMPLVEKYGAAQDALDEWNQALPEKLKKSILQEAIQGKLVPQDPADEPASVLLERIREEKKRLVKEGKLKKKDLEVRPIEEEEIPFEIPESWEWVRLKTISDKIVDGDHNPPHGLSYDSSYYMLSSKNINHDTIECLDDVRCLSVEDWKKSNERTSLKKGDVLLTTVATLGRSCVYENDISYCFQRSVSVIHTFVYNYFLKYCFDSPFYQSLIEDKATGTAQRGFYLNQLEESIIPLPPLAEQRRIVAKIEEVFGVIKH
jgi:type I restriction enzyme S subunit